MVSLALASSLQKSYAASTTTTARPHIRAATNTAITLDTYSTRRIPHSQDSDNVEREIETIEREISGCHPGMTSSRM
jgi:hypothetical protein